MSQADSTDTPRGVYVQKPKADIYTVMLAIALVAILVACVCLFLEMRAYNYDIKATEGKFRGAMLRHSLPVASRSLTSELPSTTLG
ncbi:MAG: hypothetical protein KF708_01525 [Pirellulales bacterium]|nr:hypothetical protein [Pirellulales bacterium]